MPDTAGTRPEAGCAAAARQAGPPAPAAAAAPAAAPPPPKSAAELALESGVASYDAGDYNAAIKTLGGSSDIAVAPTPIKLKAMKYTAFSYCVTNRRTQCRQQFVEALKLDPAFTLEPAELTHPIWGAEYNAAKRIASQPAKPPPSRRQAAGQAGRRRPGAGCEVIATRTPYAAAALLAALCGAASARVEVPLDDRQRLHAAPRRRVASWNRRAPAQLSASRASAATPASRSSTGAR